MRIYKSSKKNFDQKLELNEDSMRDVIFVDEESMKKLAHSK